jgi:hypothetical protein
MKGDNGTVQSVTWTIQICRICFSVSYERIMLQTGESSSHAASKKRLYPVNLNSEAITVFANSNAGIVGSNPTQGMDDCVRLFCVCVVLRVGSGLAPG